MSEAVDLKYRAFLSYAHADVWWSKWLHHELEKFRIDKDLVDRPTSMGTIPRSLRPIFRDREDFSGGRSLTDATIAALDASAAMIVLCSRVAASRQAVNEEVRLFRSRHPRRPIIPVIIDGVYPENFPLALRSEVTPDGMVLDRPVTILGPDLRESGDGRTLGLAKVVAGLTGVATDEIVRRAEREQRRRARRWLAGLSCLATSLAGLSGWAEINRREAVEKRRIADDERRHADEMFASSSEILTNLAKREMMQPKNAVLPAARALYERGANRGNTTAMVNLAKLYDFGRGVEQSYHRAREWYQKAFAGGNPDGLNGLGELHAHGKGTPADLAKARELFEQAAAAGSARAMANLGHLHSEGIGVEKSTPIGITWLNKAIEKGDSWAPRLLGDIFANGRGVKIDLRRAEDLYHLAAQRGDVGAKFLTSEKRLDELIRRKQEVSGSGVGDRIRQSLLDRRAREGDPAALRVLADQKAQFDASYLSVQEARKLYEQAVTAGDRLADDRLKDLTIIEAVLAGRYAQALNGQEGRVQDVERAEVMAQGQAGARTADALGRLAFCYLLNGKAEQALTAAQRATAISPSDLFVKAQVAHALALSGRTGESHSIYSAHTGQRVRERDPQTWEQLVTRQLSTLRKAGVHMPEPAGLSATSRSPDKP